MSAQKERDKSAAKVRKLESEIICTEKSLLYANRDRATLMEEIDRLHYGRRYTMKMTIRKLECALKSARAKNRILKQDIKRLEWKIAEKDSEAFERIARISRDRRGR